MCDEKTNQNRSSDSSEPQASMSCGVSATICLRKAAPVTDALCYAAPTDGVA